MSRCTGVEDLSPLQKCGELKTLDVSFCTGVPRGQQAPNPGKLERLLVDSDTTLQIPMELEGKIRVVNAFDAFAHQLELLFP